MSEIPLFSIDPSELREARETVVRRARQIALQAHQIYADEMSAVYPTLEAQLQTVCLQRIREQDAVQKLPANEYDKLVKRRKWEDLKLIATVDMEVAENIVAKHDEFCAHVDASRTRLNQSEREAQQLFQDTLAKLQDIESNAKIDEALGIDPTDPTTR